MKKKYLIINSFMILLGVILLLIGLLMDTYEGLANEIIVMVFANLGTAIIAAGIASIISTLILSEEKKDIFNNKWGLVNIYQKRSEMNMECDEKLRSCSKNLDFIAFGLKNFRNAATDMVGGKLQNGVRIRILTISPSSDFVKQREKEEDAAEGSIKNEIIGLIKWAKNLNEKNLQNKIEIRIYDGLPQFSYQRIDGDIFVGPNLYKVISQKCITYHYEKDGDGFRYFSEYFESLWKDNEYSQNIDFEIY